MAKNYKKPDVANIKPGYKNVAWISPLSSFTTLAAPDPEAVDEAKYIIEDDHVFPVGKGFIEVTLTRNKNTGTGESKGDPGASWMNWKGKIVIPGDGPKVQALVQEILNDDLIILQKDANCDQNTVVQYGCTCNPSSLSAVAFDGGVEGGDSGKGWTIDFETSCRDFYQGTIAVQPL